MLLNTLFGEKQWCNIVRARYFFLNKRQTHFGNKPHVLKTCTLGIHNKSVFANVYMIVGVISLQFHCAAKSFFEKPIFQFTQCVR